MAVTATPEVDMRGSGYLFILMPAAILWFIVVWFTQIHSIEWRQPAGWFALGRAIGFLGAILLGMIGVYMSWRSQVGLMVVTTAITLFIYIFREFRNRSLLIRLKIMLAWVITDSIFGWLSVNLWAFPRL
jgi:hypothetical protein